MSIEYDSSIIAACRAVSTHPAIKESDVSHSQKELKQLYGIESSQELTKERPYSILSSMLYVCCGSE
jgi:hypothetical protein